MKVFWMLWWGRSTNPIREVKRDEWTLHILALIVVIAVCSLSPLIFRILICMVVSILFWNPWIAQVKKLSGASNLLVPQLRQRLLKTSMLHWLMATLLFAFAATIRDRLDYFFSMGFFLGYGLLAFTWLASLRNRWIAVAASSALGFATLLIVDFFNSDVHPSIIVMILVLGWLLMPVLAWFVLNRFLMPNGARYKKTDRLRRSVPFRDAIHHWFLRRMTRACNNTALRPAVLERVRLEARLNTCFGPNFHWSSCFTSWWFVIMMVYMMTSENRDSSATWFEFFRKEMLVGLLLLNVRSFFLIRHDRAPSTFTYRTKTSFGRNSEGYLDFRTKNITNTKAILMKNLLFLAPGLPQGVALHQAHARIRLRYFLIVWASAVAMYTLAFSGFEPSVLFHVIVMIASAELAMAGKYLVSIYHEIETSTAGKMFKKVAECRIPIICKVPIQLIFWIFWPSVSTKYVWLLLMFAPAWFIESISLPLWSVSCLFGGAAYLWLRWQKLATLPDGLPSEWK